LGGTTAFALEGEPPVAHLNRWRGLPLYEGKGVGTKRYFVGKMGKFWERHRYPRKAP